MTKFLSLWKVDEPIGRLSFLINSILIFVVMLVLTAPFYTLIVASHGKPNIITFILGLVSFYLAFVNIVKRVWDLTARKMSAVWITVGYIIVSLIPFINALVGFAAFIVLFFIPGRGYSEDEE